MNVCDECAMRLFNIKQYNLKGVGNPSFGRCIVIPNVDYIAYKNRSVTFSEQVKVIEDILHSSTGEVDILNSLYIVPLIRCCEKLGCELTDDIYNRCITYFAQDVKKYNFHNILLLGDAGRKFLNCDIKNNLDTLVISKNRRLYNVNYSPLIKYVDEDKFEVFKTYLIRWWHCSSNSIYYNYYNYNIVTL